MRNIILVGFMGTGKTTVAKILSEKNNFQFHKYHHEYAHALFVFVLVRM